jgi:hypothetical protein
MEAAGILGWKEGMVDKAGKLRIMRSINDE